VQQAEPHPLDVSVVVPVYDEVAAIDALVERVRATLDGHSSSWELIVVDDGSRDGTGERLDELAAVEPRLRVLHLAQNSGQSAALWCGFLHARGRVIATLDGDLQVYPEDIPGLLNRLENDGVDAVVGIRAERRDTAWKRFSSRFANAVRNRLTREEIVDTGCPIKAIRTDAARSVTPFNGMHRFLPTLLRMNGHSVVEVPVRHTARISGKSKYGTLDRALRGLRDALGVRWLQDRHLRWRLR
jgi:glycosyltransferase involved in cell wall biosynthesis